jgi:hypothetical protein
MTLDEVATLLKADRIETPSWDPVSGEPIIGNVPEGVSPIGQPREGWQKSLVETVPTNIPGLASAWSQFGMGYRNLSLAVSHATFEDVDADEAEAVTAAKDWLTQAVRQTLADAVKAGFTKAVWRRYPKFKIEGEGETRRYTLTCRLHMLRD